MKAVNTRHVFVLASLGDLLLRMSWCFISFHLHVAPVSFPFSCHCCSVQLSFSKERNVKLFSDAYFSLLVCIDPQIKR